MHELTQKPDPKTAGVVARCVDGAVQSKPVLYKCGTRPAYIGVGNVVLIATALGVAIGALFEEPVAKEEIKPMPLAEPDPTAVAKVVLHKNIFFQLLKQCASDRPEV